MQSLQATCRFLWLAFEPERISDAALVPCLSMGTGMEAFQAASRPWLLVARPAPGPARWIRSAGIGSRRIFLRKADGTALPRVQRIRFGVNAGFELGGEMSSLAFHQSNFGIIRPSQTSQSFNKPLSPFPGTTSPYRREDKPCTLIVLRQCASCEHMIDRILECTDHLNHGNHIHPSKFTHRMSLSKLPKTTPFSRSCNLSFPRQFNPKNKLLVVSQL